MKRGKPFGPLNQCEHSRMRWHCYIKGRPCGHLVCPTCGFEWDEGTYSAPSHQAPGQRCLVGLIQPIVRVGWISTW